MHKTVIEDSERHFLFYVGTRRRLNDLSIMFEFIESVKKYDDAFRVLQDVFPDFIIQVIWGKML